MNDINNKTNNINYSYKEKKAILDDITSEANKSTILTSNYDTYMTVIFIICINNIKLINRKNYWKKNM